MCRVNTPYTYKNKLKSERIEYNDKQRTKISRRI